MKTFISLGAGVQSSTMALMYAAGELSPMPDGAIFADTQAEPASVYKWLDWLEAQLPFPVHRVTAGNLEAEALRRRVSKKGKSYFKRPIPVFTLGRTLGQLRRKCTRDFKIEPIVRTVRRLASVKRGEKKVQVIQLIGISLDEVRRMKPSSHVWIEHRWPLVDARMTRQDCLAWMKGHGFPAPPRSACVFCPYHNDAEWKRLKEAEPVEFLRAVRFEKALQASSEEGKGTMYLHASRKPLEEVDFRSDVEAGQGLLFDEECEGLCGV